MHFLKTASSRFGGNVQLQQNQRALTFMGSSSRKQREHSRIQLPIRAIAIFPQTSGVPHTALLRDMNMLGAFFYCRQSPEVGQTGVLEFSIAEGGNKTNITCEGVVVRVEEPSDGSAMGVAMRFAHYELCRQSNRFKYTLESGDMPFINWTVEMVERLFRTRRMN
jgi:hypothetical protein